MSDKLSAKLEELLPQLLTAIIILTIGILLSKLVVKILATALKKSKAEEIAHTFLISLVRSLLYIIVIIITLTKLNVPMTSIIATLSAAGLAIGLALQSSLSNVAGGFIIMFSHPFKCGDFIEVDKVTGTVNAITILYTRLLTTDNKAVLIPNGTIANAIIINYTQEDYRRLDMTFSIDYNADYHKAISLIHEIIANDPLALTEPEPPTVVMSEHSTSAIKLLSKVWVKSTDYWTLNYNLLQLVKDKFDSEEIVIPYDQLEIHVNSSDSIGNVKKK